MEHSHIIGGSTAKRRINCPGSLSAEKAAPEPPESDYALQGTVFHAAMELLHVADPQSVEEENDALEALIGQDMGYGPEWQITKEQLEAKIIPAWEAFVELDNKYKFEDWFIEQRVSLERVVPGGFGTSDFLAIDKAKRMHVLDYKFGDGVPVPVEGNEGLGFYAGSALYDDDPELQECFEEITGVVLHIIQPRIGDDTVLHTWETTEEWVEDLVDQIDAAMKLAVQDNAPLKPGDWCQFCKAAALCDARKGMATDALSRKPESMTAVDLATAIKMADALKSWIGDVYKLAQREMEAGAAIPGYKLVNKKPRRVWADPEAAEADMRKARMKVGDFMDRKMKSPTQIEKINKKLYAKKLHKHVVLHSSGLTVVPDSDKRQAVVSSAELLSNALPEQKQKQKQKQE